MMSKQTGKRGKRVVVIGASMAGLLAARVLADHFEQVTLLERDTFPAPGANRKGVPQGKHTHVLLELGRQIMEKYLPGLTDELTRLGATSIADASLNVRWFHSGGYHRPGVSGISGVGVSRPTLEALVRARVLALPNVRAVEDCNVLGLVTTADNGRVTGVRLVRRQAGSVEETMMADVVVDASGRGSRSPAWEAGVGEQPPGLYNHTYMDTQLRKSMRRSPLIRRSTRPISSEQVAHHSLHLTRYAARFACWVALSCCAKI